MSQKILMQLYCQLNPQLGSQQFYVTKDTCRALMPVKSPILVHNNLISQKTLVEP